MTLPLYYNWRNLFARRLSALLTLFVVAVIVLVLAVLLSFGAGIRSSLVASGSDLNVLVLKPGATAESTSIVRPDEIARIVQAPGIARDADGNLMLSQELCIQTTIPRLSSPDRHANVAVRGVDDIAFEVHGEVRIVEGRRFSQGALEAVVGRAAQARYAHLRIGEQVRLGRAGNREFTVVGVFEARGGALESEIWTPRTILSDVSQRAFVSSIALRMTDPAAARAAVEFINGPSVGLRGKRETDYYEELSAKTEEIVVLTMILVGIMGIGAVFAVANTMYAAVDGRRREIAMLRTIGFSRAAVLLAFIIESVLLCTLACSAGLLVSLAFSGMREDFLSDTTWTVLAYEVKVTPQVFIAAILTSVLVGVVGAVAPALRAARTRPIDALRNA
jgi:putative ABC transport system permease protein